MKSVVVLIEEEKSFDVPSDICSRVFYSEKDAWDLYHKLVKDLNDVSVEEAK